MANQSALTASCLLFARLAEESLVFEPTELEKDSSFRIRGKGDDLLSFSRSKPHVSVMGEKFWSVDRRLANSTTDMQGISLIGIKNPDDVTTGRKVGIGSRERRVSHIK